MTDVPRYAIYYAAAAGSPLDRFGAGLLGHDALSGEELPFPDGIEQLLPDWREITRDPRKYGFHATLKAPFSLAQGKTARIERLVKLLKNSNLEILWKHPRPVYDKSHLRS